MATQEKWAAFAGKVFLRGLRDADFRAARVGDESMRRSVPRNFRKQVYRRGDGQGDVDEVGALQCCGDVTVERRIDGASCVSFTNDVGAVPAGDANVRRVFVQRQTEGPADQAGAEDRNAGDKVSRRQRSSNAAADRGSND